MTGQAAEKSKGETNGVCGHATENDQVCVCVC